MKLGIMQPYFFPYIGYFSLIKNTDYFIFFDTPQYERRSWMNRNRILNANGEAVYITVPTVKAPQKTAIKDIQIDNSREWAKSMLAKLTFYQKNAPYYKETLAFLESVLSEDYESLADLNVKSTIATCKYLGIDQKFDVFSDMNLEIGEVNEADEWALEITKALPDYDTYINPPGGKSFFSQEKYEKNHISLKFLQSKLPEYEQKLDHFERGLSIIDALMFNSVEQVRNMLDEIEFV